MTIPRNLGNLAQGTNTDGVLQPSKGGTGATSTANAPFAQKGANSDITSLTGLTTPLSIAQGGTNATSAANALTELGAYPASNPSGFTSNTGTVTSVGGTGTVNGLTLSGTVTSSGNLTLGGTLTNVDLTSQVTGTLPAANGGTGLTSPGANGNVLTSNGTAWVSSPSSSLPAPNTPSITTVSETNPANTIITSSAYSVSNNAEFYSSDWQVSTNSGFTNIIAQSLNDSVNKTSWSANLGSYNGSTVYIRVRYRTSAGIVSEYSNTYTFNVPALVLYYPTVYTNTLNGTHTFTQNYSNVRVWVIGGGGSGANNYGAGGGGGAGGFINLGNVTSGQSFTYVVGAGGGESAEVAGGYSQIVWNGTTYRAGGGSAGSPSSPYPGGNGGTIISGNFTASSSGGKGGDGGNNNTIAQVGANSAYGGGGGGGASMGNGGNGGTTGGYGGGGGAALGPNSPVSPYNLGIGGTGGAGGYNGGSGTNTDQSSPGGAPSDVTVPPQGNTSFYGGHGGGYFGGGGGGHAGGAGAGVIVVKANAY